MGPAGDFFSTGLSYKLYVFLHFEKSPSAVPSTQI
jgi:hypothetical protein